MTASGDVLDVGTPTGTARVHIHRPVAGHEAGWTLVLGHGAGGGVGARDLTAVARSLPARGVAVLLVEQPWRVAGKPVAAPPPRLDEAWLHVLADPRVGAVLVGDLVVGGRSAGARVACRTATDVGAAAVVCLAFPLHPPGRPDRSRAGELLAAGAPTLVIQGDRDAFGGPAELPRGPRVVTVPFADHAFAVPAKAPITQTEALEILVGAVATAGLPVGRRHAGG